LQLFEDLSIRESWNAINDIANDLKELPEDLKECGTSVNDGGRLEQLSKLVEHPWEFTKKIGSAMWWNGANIRREFGEIWSSFRANDFENIGKNMGEFFVEIFFYNKFLIPE